MSSAVQRGQSSGPVLGLLAGSLLFAAAAGCGHAHSVAETSPTHEDDHEGDHKDEHRASKAAGHEGERKAKEPTSMKVEGVALSSSPAALLRPGAAHAIQLRLVKSGELTESPSGQLDGATRAALARFQRAHDLPATGVPDNATVGKLGLKSDDVFESNRDAQTGAKDRKVEE